MAQFLPVRPDQPQEEARDRINTNFTNATIVPEGTAGTDIQLVGLISGSNQLYNAVDGEDFLSPDTGIMKDATGGQTIGGDLVVEGSVTADSLDVGPNGAKVKDHFEVYDSGDNKTFEVNTAGNGIFYGRLNVNNNTTITGAMTVSGGITSNTAANTLGQSSFTTLTATSGTIATLNATNATIGALTVSGALRAGTLTVTGGGTLSGNFTFNNSISMASPGAINIAYVRPIYAGTAAVPSNLPTGVLYGQY